MMRRSKKGYLILIVLILLLAPAVFGGIAEDNPLLDDSASWDRDIAYGTKVGVRHRVSNEEGWDAEVEIGDIDGRFCGNFADETDTSIPPLCLLGAFGYSRTTGEGEIRHLENIQPGFGGLMENQIRDGIPEEDGWARNGCYVAADTTKTGDFPIYKAAAALVKQGTILNDTRLEAAPLREQILGSTLRQAGIDTSTNNPVSPTSALTILQDIKIWSPKRADEGHGELLCYSGQWITCGVEPALTRYPVVIPQPDDGTGVASYGSFFCDGNEWKTWEEVHTERECTTNAGCIADSAFGEGYTCHANICLNTRYFRDTLSPGVTCPFGLKSLNVRSDGDVGTHAICLLDEDGDNYNVVNLLSPDGTGPDIDCVDDPVTDPGRTDADAGICGSVTQEMCRSNPAAYWACAACTNPGMPDFIGDNINNNCKGEAVASIDELDPDGDRWLAWTEEEMEEEYRTVEELQGAVIGDVVNGIGDCVNTGAEFEERYPDDDARTRLSFLERYDFSAGDAAEAINPGAVEACDLVDNDCDGRTDEGCVADESQSMCEGIEGDTWISSEAGGGAGCCGDDYPGSLENFGIREATTPYAACLNSVPVANDGTGGRDLVPKVVPPDSLWTSATGIDGDFTVFNIESPDYLQARSEQLNVPAYLRGRTVKFTATVVVGSSEPIGGTIQMVGKKQFSGGTLLSVPLGQIDLPITRGMEKQVSGNILLPSYPDGNLVSFSILVTRATTDTIIKIKDIHLIVEEEAKVLYYNDLFYACSPTDDIKNIKMTTKEGTITLPAAALPLIDRDDYRDTCDNVGSWYCSIGSSDELSIWKQAPDSETLHDTVKYIPAVEDDAEHGIEGPERGCCPTNYCWTGTSCNPHDAGNPSRTTGLNLLNENKYVCDAGPAGDESAVWKPAEEKTDQFGREGGVCSWDQCYYNDGSLSRKDDDTCVRDGYIPPDTIRNPDAICSNGEWESRTMLLARKLLLVDFDSNDYSLSCGEQNDVLLQPIPETLMNCGGAPCVEKACVLRSKDTIVLGFVLNNPLDAAYELEPAKFQSSFLKAFGKDEFEVTTDAVAADNQHHKYCDDVIATSEDEYEACTGDERLRYNPATNSIMFSENDFSFTSDLWRSFTVALLGKDILKDLPTREQTMSKLYASRDNSKQISGAVYLAGGAERMSVGYNNIEDNVCNPLEQIALDCRPYAMPSLCVLGICVPRWQFKAETSTSLEWWNDLTAKTRMPGTTWSPDEVAAPSRPSEPTRGETPIGDSLPLDDLRTGSTDIRGDGLGGFTGRVVQSLDDGGLPFITGRTTGDVEEQSVMEDEVVEVAVTLTEDELDAVAYTIDFGDGDMISVTSPEGLSPAPQHSYTLPDGENEEEYTVNLRVLKEDGNSFTTSSREILEVKVKRDAKNIDHDGDGQTFNQGDVCEERLAVEIIETTAPELQSTWFLEQCLDGIDNDCDGATDEAGCSVIPPRGPITAEWEQGTDLPPDSS